MSMINRFMLPLFATVLVLGMNACDEPESTPTVDERGITLLAEVELDDFKIQFTKSPAGAIVVSEDGPVEHPSYVAHLVIDLAATPLEMFVALSPDADVPEALQADHTERTQEPPRALTIPTVAFRGITVIESAANCTLASDGAWFDGQWSARGWSTHWYWNGTDTSKTAPQQTTSDFVTHVCNNTVTPDTSVSFNHYLFDRSLPGAQLVASNQAIRQGRRNVITVTGTSGTYEAEATLASWADGNYKLGIQAP